MANSSDNNYVPPATFGRVKQIAREEFGSSDAAIEYASRILLKGNAVRYVNVAGRHVVTELFFVDV